MKAARLPLALVALSALTACEAPTGQPSPIPTAPSPSAPSSQIIVHSMSPSSGAKLPVDKCRYYPSSFNLDFWEICADGLSLRFDVEFEADVTNAVVTAGFYSGDSVVGRVRPTALRVAGRDVENGGAALGEKPPCDAIAHPGIRSQLWVLTAVDAPRSVRPASPHFVGTRRFSSSNQFSPTNAGDAGIVNRTSSVMGYSCRPTSRCR